MYQDIVEKEGHVDFLIFFFFFEVNIHLEKYPYTSALMELNYYCYCQHVCFCLWHHAYIGPLSKDSHQKVRQKQLSPIYGLNVSLIPAANEL